MSIQTSARLMRNDPVELDQWTFEGPAAQQVTSVYVVDQFVYLKRLVTCVGGRKTLTVPPLDREEVERVILALQIYDGLGRLHGYRRDLKAARELAVNIKAPPEEK